MLEAPFAHQVGHDFGSQRLDELPVQDKDGGGDVAGHHLRVGGDIVVVELRQVTTDRAAVSKCR